MSYVFDSSAVLAFLNKEPGAQNAAAKFANSHISVVNVAEVFTKLIARGMIRTDAFKSFSMTTLSVQQLDIEQALDAGGLVSVAKPLGLSLGDRICLSLARKLALPVVTADRVWSKLNIGVDIQLLR